MFSLFRHKEKKKEDFSFIGTDMHSHLLPNLDDGCNDIISSLECIIKLKELGFKKLITTPHVMSGVYPNTPSKIQEKLALLQRALHENNIEITLEAAAEYKIDELFLKYLEEDNILTLGSNYILIELSFIAPPISFEEIIFKILTKGYKPILAHPERYNYLSENLEVLQSIKAKGCLLQINLMSLIGQYGAKAKEISNKLLQEGMIDFLATDLHRPEDLNILKRLLNSENKMKHLKRLTLLNNKL